MERLLPKIICHSDYLDSKKPHRWVLEEPVTIRLSNGKTITITAGYKTDFASVPRGFWGIIQTSGRHNLATLVHDWLYDTQYSITEKKDWKKDRLFADREMLYWLKKSGVSWIKRQLMYYAVRLGGKSWFLT
jgi:hypothetical protein